MLGKVFTYEMRASFRFLGPASLAGILALVSTLAGRGFSAWLLAQPPGSQMHTFGVILSTIIGVFGSILFSIILYLFIGALAVRFYKSFSGAEAYTTFSLPVKISTQLTGHLLSTTVYVFLGSVLACLCMVFFVLPLSFGGEIFLLSTPGQEFAMSLADFPTGNIALLALGFFLFFFLSMMYSVLNLWACIAIGGQFSARIAMSVAAYFVLNIVESIVTLALAALSFFLWAESYGGFEKMNQFLNSLNTSALMTELFQWLMGMLGLMAVGFVLFSVVHVLLCRWLFTKRLNLA